jgi:hypothetical protein
VICGTLFKWNKISINRWNGSMDPTKRNSMGEDIQEQAVSQVTSEARLKVVGLISPSGVWEYILD